MDAWHVGGVTSTDTEWPPGEDEGSTRCCVCVCVRWRRNLAPASSGVRLGWRRAILWRGTDLLARGLRANCTDAHRWGCDSGACVVGGVGTHRLEALRLPCVVGCLLSMIARGALFARCPASKVRVGGPLALFWVRVGSHALPLRLLCPA